MSQAPMIPATPENIALVASKPDDPKTQNKRMAKLSDLLANKDKRYYFDLPGIGTIEWKKLTVNEATEIQKASATYNVKKKTMDMDQTIALRMTLLATITNPKLSEENFEKGNPNELDGTLALMMYQEIEKSSLNTIQDEILLKK